jgi:hypothetical protein
MRRIPKTLLLLVILAYTGQATLVVAFPCAMMSGSAGGMDHDTSHMDHAGHDMPMDGDPAAGDCCDGGYCSASHCQMAPGVPSPFPTAAAETYPVLFTVMPIPTVNAPPESPYRPPISA